MRGLGWRLVIIVAFLIRANHAAATFEQGDELEECERAWQMMREDEKRAWAPPHASTAQETTARQLAWELASRNQGIFAGVISGLVNSVTCYHLDNWMTRQQVTGICRAAPGGGKANSTVLREHCRKYSWGTLTSTIGLAWVLWSRPKFESSLSRYLGQGCEDQPQLDKQTSGWISKAALVEMGASIGVGAGQAVVVAPFSTMKVRAQTNNDKAILSGYWELKQQEQISARQRGRTIYSIGKALWSGTNVAAGRNITFWLVQDPVQKVLQESHLVQVGLKEVNGFIKEVGVGGVSGLVAALPAYPWDKISKIKKNESSNAPFYKVAAQVWKHEGGVRAFYRGFPLCGARMFVACAVLNTAKEGVNDYFKAHNSLAASEARPLGVESCQLVSIKLAPKEGAPPEVDRKAAS